MRRARIRPFRNGLPLAIPHNPALATDAFARRFCGSCIGMRYQGTVIADKALAHGDMPAICDVDRNVRKKARAAFGGTPAIYEDNRGLPARNDIDGIMMGTIDH